MILLFHIRFTIHHSPSSKMDEKNKLLSLDADGSFILAFCGGVTPIPFSPLPDTNLAYPSVASFQDRISNAQWSLFMEEVWSVYFKKFEPPLGLAQMCMMCIPGTMLVYMYSKQAAFLKATYEWLAKYNKFLFNPRGIQVILQRTLEGTASYRGEGQYSTSFKSTYYLKFVIKDQSDNSYPALKLHVESADDHNRHDFYVNSYAHSTMEPYLSDEGVVFSLNNLCS